VAAVDAVGDVLVVGDAQRTCIRFVFSSSASVPTTVLAMSTGDCERPSPQAANLGRRAFNER
jgi:hypothetical protein